LLFFLKSRKKDFLLKIQETRLDQINQEVSKKQHEIDFLRRKLEEQKIKFEQEENRLKNEREKLSEEFRRLKIEQEKLVVESRRISEEKNFIEQENNKLQQRIQNVKEKFQEVIKQIDQKNEEVENEIIRFEGERKAFEIERGKLEILKKEIADTNKQMQVEWQKLKLQKEQIEKQKNELAEQSDEIRKKEEQIIEDRKFIDDEKERIEGQWRQISAKKEEIEKQANCFNAREKEIGEKEQQLDKDRELLETEKIKFQIKQQELELREQDIKKRLSELENITNRLKKEIQQKWQKLKKRKRLLDIQKNKVKNHFKKLRIIALEIKQGKNWTTEAIEKILREIEELFPAPQPRKKTKIIPELICQKKGGCWQLAIKISGRLPDCFNLKITQDDLNLVRDEVNEDYWPLISMNPIFIEWKDGDRSKRKKYELQEDGTAKPLLFKLLSKNDNIGKFVSAPSSGSYFAIVPEDWVREESLSGSEPAKPEHISIKGFRGHFFILQKSFNFIIAFKNSYGELVTIEPKGSRFYLNGNQIIDANEEASLLFGERFPSIVDSIKKWNDIGTIIIEEETDNINKHQWILEPDINSSEIDINKIAFQGDLSLSQSTSSSFSISFYDKKYHLIDNLYFRYIQGIKKIAFSDYSSMPLANGHPSIDIKFLHDKSCVIKLCKTEISSDIVKQDEKGTTAIIPPDPAWDLTDWEIQDEQGRRVNIELLVERLWWNLGNEEDQLISNDWSSAALELPKEYISSNSHYVIVLQFPRVGWIKNVFIGFDKKRRKEYRVLPSQRSIRIPLRDFCDYREITKFDDHAKLLLWINKYGLEGEVCISTIKAITPPPPPPPPPPPLNNRPCCYNCDHARIKFNNYWCRRYNWPQRAYDSDYFIENIAHFKCGEWRGEYQDKNGGWLNK